MSAETGDLRELMICEDLPAHMIADFGVNFHRDFESIVKLTDEFNGADLRNVVTEAGMFAIREGRDYVLQGDFMLACR